MVYQRLIKKAEKAFENGQYLKAAKLYEEIIRNDYRKKSEEAEAAKNFYAAIEYAWLAGNRHRALKIVKRSKLRLEGMIKDLVEELRDRAEAIHYQTLKSKD